jgi:proline iminopeptidase
MTSRTQGLIDVGAGNVWYESAGEGDRSLLLLHGGPGGNSEDLAPFLELADRGFRVVRYDQLGSWRSDKPDDLTLWQFPRFVREVERVRQALDLGRMHLLGQSWGAFLAIEYALRYGNQLRSLTLASGAASTRECVAGMDAWRLQLPQEIQSTLARYEAVQDYQNPDYLAAMDVLYRQNFCRVQPYPEPLARAMEHMAAPVYNTMWGPNEFTCTGNLLDWDCTDRLGEITAPTLITVGEFDEVDPSCARTLQAGIARSELRIFPGCGHAVHLEDYEHYRSVLLNFLNRVDELESVKVAT